MLRFMDTSTPARRPNLGRAAAVATATRIAVPLVAVLALVAVTLVAATPPASARTAGPVRLGPSAAQRALDGDPATTERILERDPVAAAIDLSQARFAAATSSGRRAAHVVLSRDNLFADSLAAAPLSADGPLLFTATDRLHTDTRAEIARVLAPGGRVQILGGTQAVGSAVEDRLRTDGYRVVRLAGATRIETALAVAGEVRRRSRRSEVLLVRANAPRTNPTAAWADSVSGGALAAAARIPVLVTPSDTLAPAVAAWLRRDAPSVTVLLGGPAALAPAVEAAVPNPLRVAGADRAATAAAVATRLWGARAEGPRTFVMVNGVTRSGWAFGLAAAGVAADARAPVLLLTDQVTAPTLQLANSCGKPQVDTVLVGDGAVVSGRLREQLDAYDGQACGRGGSLVVASSLDAFDACPTTLNYFVEHALERVGPYGLESSGGVGMPEARRVGPLRGDEGAAAEPGSGVSGTNVQEEGVDEPDLLKTDGRLAAVVARDRLQVVDLTGAAPRLASNLDLPAGHDHELLLEGSRLLVLSRSFTTGGEVGPAPVEDVRAASSPVRVGTPRTVLALFDVTDPTAPREVAILELEGAYRSARLVDGVARVVVESQPEGSTFTQPRDSSREAAHAAAEHNRQVVRNSGLDDWLPSYRLTDRRSGTAVTSDGALLSCDQVRQPPWFAGLGTVAVFGIDLAGSLQPTSAAAVVAAGETVYSSPTGLYVTTSRWNDWEPGLVGEAVTTEVHAFDIADAAAIRYVASGSVPGFVLNQFSLSEHQGYLRIATTEQAPWQPDGAQASSSSVRVLDEVGDQLAEVGRVEGLGRGERIFAVRFLGDLAAVVTFRQVDPLYLIDLTDPTAPRVRGELKIPGYSAYLHRVAPDRLLGVGQDADADGRVLGAQVSLFDIGDPASPRLVDRVPFPGGHSPVESDHHAFLYWPASRLAVVPMWIEEPDFNGAVGIRVAPADLSEAARVSHGSGSEAVTPETEWPTDIRRSFVVDTTLYTVSQRGLMASDLDSLAERSFLPFASQ